MKNGDYYRLYSELMANSVIEFSERSKLIQFISELVSCDYLQYLSLRRDTTTKLNEYVDFEERQKSEPRLVVTYVRAFLNERVPFTDDKWYEFKRKLLRRPQSRVVFDSRESTELYNFVLERLKRNGEAVEDVFTPGIRYTIVGDKTLRREVL